MFRVFKGFLLVVLAVVLSTQFLAAQSTVFVVDDDGDPLTTYPTLQAAIATAQTFPNGPHEIKIMPGTYHGSGLAITVPSKIAKIYGDPGSDRADIIFDAPTYQTVNFFDVGGTTDLEIGHFTVQNYVYGLTGTDLTGIHVFDIAFDNNGEDGYNAPGPNYLDNGGAIRFKNCDNGTIEDLEIMNGERGIRLDANGSSNGSDGNTVMNCVAHDMEQYGVGIYPNGNNNTVDGCTVYNCLDRGIQIGYSTNAGNVVQNCLVYDCSNDGIINDGSTGGSIIGNTVFGCATTTATFSNPGTQPVHGGIALIGAGVVTGNTSYNNGDGAGTGDYGLYVGGTYCDVGDNCFYGHAGVQATDVTGGNYWHGNYYGDVGVSGNYALDGGMGVIDYSPVRRTNTPVAASSTMEVWSTQVVEFMWAHPATCDPSDSTGLAAYEFTVHWDPTKLQLVDRGYDEFLGASGDALYILSGDPGSGNATFSGINVNAPNSGEGRLAWIEFEAVGVGAASVTLSSYYRDVNNNDIPVQEGSLNLTLQDTEAPAVTVTPNNPIGDDTYSDGTGNVKLYIEGTATDNYGLASVWYRFDDAGGWTMIKALSGTSDTYGGLPTDYYVNITGLAAGAHNINVIALDASGNRDSVYYNFNIDRTGPVLTSITMSDADNCAINANYTNDPTVTVTLVDDGTAATMEFYRAGWEGPIAYAATTSYTLPSTDGPYTLYARLYDVYGNMGNQLSDAITLDQVAPVPHDLLLAGGAAKTNTTSITADAFLDVPGGAVEMNFSDNAANLVCGDAGWQVAPPAVRPWPVTLSSGDGTKTYYLAVRDLAGNISAVISDDIVLDQTAPDFDAFAVTDIDGDECAQNWIVNVTVSWSDPDVKWLHLGSATGTYDVSVDLSAETSPFTVAYTILSGYRNPNGLNTVFGALEDDIANVGTEASDDVFIDRTAPTITSVLATDPDYDGVDPTIHMEWSNQTDLKMTVTGLAADVVELQVVQDGTFDGDQVSFPISSVTDPYVFTYNYTGATECAALPVYIRALDCSGRISAVVSDNIYFDFQDPAIASFDVTSADPTNVLSATLGISGSDNCAYWKMNVYEDGYETSGSGWIGTGTSFVLALQNIGDGTRTIHLVVTDGAGNTASATTTVLVDQTPPTGNFTIQQFGNPFAMPGYTNSTTSNEIVGVTADADVTTMQVYTAGGTSAIVPLAASYSPVTIAGGDGAKIVQMRFRDLAGNWGAWVPKTFTLLTAAPTAPAAALGEPTADGLKMHWNPAGGQFYVLKYNFTGLYPTYDDGIPPHPADTLEGIFIPGKFVSDTSYTFAGPHADIYAFSIFTVDMAGNISLSPNVDVTETNYILGDIDLDGIVEFADDFGTFATCYSLNLGDPGFNTDCDFALTDDNSGTGYPIPDGMINFEDLMIMGLNYDEYSKEATLPQGNGHKPVVGSIQLIAEVNDVVRANSEFTVSITTDNPEVVKGFHLVLDQNQSTQLVAAQPGEAFANVSESFFYRNARSENIDLTGIVMGADAKFTGNELARLTFRSTDGTFDLKDVELTVRDRQNQNIDVEFGVTAKEVLPTTFALAQNYPNPFNPTTTIEFSLPVASDFNLAIYNVAGQLVQSFSGHAEAGVQSVVWKADTFSSGVYFYRLEAGTFTDTRKMVLLK